MKFAAVPLTDAAGALLAHGQGVGRVRWAKGRVLDAADLAAAAAAGLTELTVARLDPGDVPEAEAARVLGMALAGSNVVARAPVHGRVNLAAAVAGVLLVDCAGVDALNAVDEAVTLGTLVPGSRVTAGDLVATVKIIPYAVAGATLDRAARAAAPLRIAAFRAVAVDLVQTLLPGTTAKAVAKGEAVTRARLAALGARAARGLTCAHDAGALAALLAAPRADIVLISGASATVDRGDVVPAAIVAAGGVVDRLGMPVDPGNLLCLGRVGDATVVGLPGGAPPPRRNGFDWVLERLVAGLAVSGGDIAAMGVGGLLPETPRPLPRERE